MSRPAQHPLRAQVAVTIGLESWLVDEIAMRVKNKDNKHLPTKSKIMHRALVEHLKLGGRLNAVMKEVNEDRAKEGKEPLNKITR